MDKSFLRNKYKKVISSIKNKKQLDDIIFNKIIDLEEYNKNNHSFYSDLEPLYGLPYLFMDLDNFGYDGLVVQKKDIMSF